VHPGGELIISAPFLLSKYTIERFIEQKAQWILRAVRRLKDFRPAGRRISAHQYQVYRKQALNLVLNKISALNRTYNVPRNGISIRNQKTRWGSCSKKGNLNFNYRIIFLESWLQDYIITHELCHLLEFNHSPKFWQLVTQTIPNHKQARKELRKNPILTYS